MVEARLDDRHAHRVEVIETVEEVRSAEAVETKLRIVAGVYLDALPVLQVDDLDHSAADHDRVRRSETFRHPPVEAELLLDHELRILAGGLEGLDHGIRIVAGGFLHLTAVVLALQERLHLCIELPLRDLVIDVPEL